MPKEIKRTLMAPGGTVDPRTLYVSAYGKEQGIFKSTDSGRTFERKMNGINPELQSDKRIEIILDAFIWPLQEVFTKARTKGIPGRRFPATACWTGR
jgi:hypothetical protein